MLECTSSLNSRYRCLDCTGEVMLYSPSEVRQIAVVWRILDNLALKTSLQDGELPSLNFTQQEFFGHACAVIRFA